MVNESFRIGRIRVTFPPDITEAEFKFMTVILYSYIQGQKYKDSHVEIFTTKEKVVEDKSNKAPGVS